MILTKIFHHLCSDGSPEDQKEELPPLEEVNLDGSSVLEGKTQSYTSSFGGCVVAPLVAPPSCVILPEYIFDSNLSRKLDETYNPLEPDLARGGRL
jgi:hypothetical protein